MKKLQCEICGGALVMQDGMAVCESCGMKFSKEEVKKMVVELSGPIQIDGEVKVTGIEDADALYRRAKDFERIGELEDAYDTYEDAADKYPGDGRMWLGKATVQVKINLGKCEKELKETDDNHYDDYRLRWSFEKLEWCDEIEKYYERAQSLGGVDDEAQQGLLWFRNQKETIIQKYKDKKRKRDIYRDTFDYWKKANAEFLNTFPGSKVKEEILAFLLKQDVSEVCKALKKTYLHYSSYHIKSFIDAQGRSISFRYWYYNDVYKSYPTIVGKIDLPEGMTIEGDIRPMMDGFTYKEKGLFGGKKTYSYANDPDKDKGPTFDE
ncbi:tetratricopeptide repeat protein [Pseudoflavonifractor phocaeensis]|uniref:tetratricopeptide repeat protein n=1 Tax=Pseudoflavonifractor phocaeensis TaxID=1870988 RepID=UPI001F1BB016|nr:hypothetical protein [Pseudoflavonifractor phocaeensis]MCF2660948.1 hypothetical protein [Pseudoflavonifractor phocaeensis]